MLRKSYALALLKWRGKALRMNNQAVVGARSLWVESGWRPPGE